MKVNKHLAIFSSLLIFLTVGYFFVLVKFFPILVHHTFYYCREMAKTISLSFPGNLGTIVFGVLLVSVLYTAFRLAATVIKVYKFRQLLSRSVVKDQTLSKTLTALKLTDKVVVLRENRPFAYCFGIRTPKIYITTGLIALVNKKELEVILRHERYHLEHLDNLILLLATLLMSLFPFFPLLTDFIRIYKTDRELLADKAAIRGEDDKTSLSSVLKKLLQYEPIAIPALAPAIADTETIETRIKTLLSIKVNYRKLGKRNLVLSMAFAGMLMTLLGTPVNAIELHDKGLDAMVVCNENVSCESVCKNRTLLMSKETQSFYSSKNFSTNN
jgi:beta-lactamase regulating signal transducer with metallopeptidase domain